MDYYALLLAYLTECRVPFGCQTHPPSTPGAPVTLLVTAMPSPDEEVTFSFEYVPMPNGEQIRKPRGIRAQNFFNGGES